MKNETWLGKLYFPVSVTLLLVAGLCRGRVQTVMTALLAAWTLLMVLHRFHFGKSLFRKDGADGKKERPVPFGSKDPGDAKTRWLKDAENASGISRETDGRPEEMTAAPRSHAASLSETELNLLLQHLSLRISDKLKSAYPEATWLWTREPVLKEVLNGTTMRIRVEHMESFTHADVCFDRFGRIHIEPMTIGTFASALTAGEGKDAEGDNEEGAGKTAEPPVTDPAVWYQLVGQKILEAQISSLNAKGHTRLSINEKGDILIRKEKSDVILATLEAFPAKTYWPDLVSILSEDELNAKITGDRLQVSWI